ncbi:hypothetical protein M3Y97_01121100 [Aphelenchoides bicaudatus]|nr:hypothetical protein M3Y97_01121100 [Aphelenchoides bicaudatus]
MVPFQHTPQGAFIVQFNNTNLVVCPNTGFAMGRKLLLPLLTLLAFYNSAWAVNEFLNSVSHRPDLFQYLAPVIPADELLFENGVLAQSGGICSKSQLAFCQQQFAGALSQTVEIFNDPIKFAELIRSYYKLQVPRGILQLCSAQLSFRNCMGIFYTPCTDAFNIFSGQSQTLDNAFILAGVYDDIEFDCGGGFTQTVAHWPCVTKVNNAADYDTTMQALC